MARKLDNQEATLAISALATSAVTGNPSANVYPGGLFVKLDTDRSNFVLAGVGDEAEGVISGNYLAGASASIKKNGIRPIEFGGTVANGAYAEVGASGQAVTATGLRPIAGKVITGGASGEVGSIELGKLPTAAIKGADVASATAIVPTGNVFHVTGTTTITSITSTGVAAGSRITIIFDAALTFTDGSNLKLAGDLVTTADDSISLVYDGTNWYETGRSVN